MSKPAAPANHPPAAKPITFRTNTILPATPTTASRFLPAGEASPWHDVGEVPPRLREYIGTPPEPQVDPVEWARETEAIQNALSDNMPEQVREELARRDAEAFATAKARNVTVRLGGQEEKGT
jgi:hypothetical protein